MRELCQRERESQRKENESSIIVSGSELPELDNSPALKKSFMIMITLQTLTFTLMENSKFVKGDMLKMHVYTKL